MATIKIKSGDQWTQIPMIGINPMPDAPSDGKTYGRKDGEWAEVTASSGSTQELTKEAIEAVFTGNVETHSHDTVYEYTEFETDVWDGTSISNSLSGSGTKEDPYLIQSCADLLHLRNDSSKYQINSASEVSGVTSFEPYFKFTKSLDFNSLTINNPTSDSSSISGCFFDIDGQGATISNFNLNVPSDRTNPGIINMGLICYYHNINVDGLNVTFEVQDNEVNILGILGGLYDGQYNIINNVTINGSVTLSGSLSYSLNNINIVCLSSGYASLSQYQNLFNSLNIKSINGGFNLTINDNTTKSNGSKLEIVRAIMGHPNMNIIGYDNSYSNITNINTGGTLYDGNTAYCTMIGYYKNVDNFYINSDKAHGFVCMNESEPPLFITSQTKTTQEIQSDEFVNELNSLVNIFRKDPDGNAPVLTPLNKAISYDGYVKQNEFDELTNIVNTLTNKDTYEIPYCLIDLSAKTKEEVFNEIGGETGFNKIIQAVKDGKQLTVSNFENAALLSISKIKAEVTTYVTDPKEEYVLCLSCYLITAYGCGESKGCYFLSTDKTYLDCYSAMTVYEHHQYP